MVRRGEGDAAEAEYIRLIRGEVDRCTTVLDQLSGRAAAASAADSSIALPRLVDDLRYRLGASLASRLDVALPADARPIDAPAEPLRQALIALLRNAFDASTPDQRVTLSRRAGGRRARRGHRPRPRHGRGGSVAGGGAVLHDQAARRRPRPRPVPRARVRRPDGRHAATAFDPGQGTAAILQLPARS